MSSLWTPDGERPVEREPAPQAPVGAGDPLREAAKAMGVDLDSLTDDERAQLQAELGEMMRVRREVAGTPAAEMLTNYLMRLLRPGDDLPGGRAPGVRGGRHGDRGLPRAARGDRRPPR